MAADPHYRMEQLVLVRGERVANHPGRHIDASARNLQTDAPERCPEIDHVRRSRPGRP